MTMRLVCSNKPRPSVHKGAKGNQFWKRDVHHIARQDKRTLCKIDASEWLDMGIYIAVIDYDNRDLCKRCRNAAT